MTDTYVYEIFPDMSVYSIPIAWGIVLAIGLFHLIVAFWRPEKRTTLETVVDVASLCVLNGIFGPANTDPTLHSMFMAFLMLTILFTTFLPRFIQFRKRENQELLRQCMKESLLLSGLTIVLTVNAIFDVIHMISQ